MHHAVASLSARTARLLSWLAEPYPVPLLLVLCASDKSQVLQSRAGQGRAQQSRAGRASPPKAASTAGAVGTCCQQEQPRYAGELAGGSLGSAHVR